MWSKLWGNPLWKENLELKARVAMLEGFLEVEKERTAFYEQRGARYFIGLKEREDFFKRGADKLLDMLVASDTTLKDYLALKKELK